MHALLTRVDRYPQRTDWDEQPLLVRIWDRIELFFRYHIKVSTWQQMRFLSQVNNLEREVSSLDDNEILQALMKTRLALRKEGYQQKILCYTFALIREASKRVLHLRHHDVQIRGGYILVHGFVAEMDTGEGKTLTATLAASVAALAGHRVQVVTVNDYLAKRDASEMRPLYEYLGLSVGVTQESDSPDAKRIAYQSDITYCTGKNLAFDYLKDRLVLDARIKPLQMLLDSYTGKWQQTVLLPGLQFTIVDEADSVLIDEARTPLVISGRGDNKGEVAFQQDALLLAQQLTEFTDFLFDDQGQRRIDLTLSGRNKLTELAQQMPSIWKNQFRREEAVLQALSALHLFQRDVHYILKDEKIQIVDEHTGRVMPDRSWEKGMQQLIELKESVPVSPPRVTLARISFQLFFRRFITLAGMSGTLKEISGEIASTYKRKVVKVPPNLPSKRVAKPYLIFPNSESRWVSVVAEIEACHAHGQPVLVGVRSIDAAEHLSQRLQLCGLSHHVLHARQDADEAFIISCAGQFGAITIATNMAGRGTDIKLSPSVLGLGGLHVLLTELHDNRRVDRQLIGRCARQGQPGSWREILSLDDTLVRDYWPFLKKILSYLLEKYPSNRFVQGIARTWFRMAQWRIERLHRRMRARLLKSEFQLRKSLSFTGKVE